MRMNRGWISTLLAVGLLAGQWLSVVHSADHVLKPATAHACAYCATTTPDDHGLAPVAPALVVDPGAVPATPRIAADDVAQTHASHPIRGPPSLPA